MAKTELPTRENILKAAEAEFLEKGYQGAWLREITKNAGVTTGAMYGYFKNKQELFGALVDREYSQILAIYDGILEQFHALPPEEQVAHMQEYTGKGMQHMTAYIYEHWNAFKLILCRSEDTKYCHLVEEMARRDQKATDDFSQTRENTGAPHRDVNETLERMLTCSMFSTFFEIVRQDLPREETEQYIHQLLDFYTGGWEKLWGC